MFALLLAGSLSSTCDYTIDLTSNSNYNSQSIYSSYGYCFRFTAPHGVFMMNKIGYATASIYAASSTYYSYISGYTYQSYMNNAYSSSTSSRAVSFGSYYGLIYVSSSTSTTIYYSYSYANSTCTEISVSSNPSKTYYFPSSSSYAYSTTTYCFIYLGYGSQSNSVYRYSGNSYDQMYYQYGYYNGYIPSSMSFSGIGYPLQLIYKPYYSTSSSLYYVSVYASSSYYDNTVEGTFSSYNSVSTLTQKTTTYTYYSSGGSAVVGITVGSVFGFIVICAIVFAILYRTRHPRVTISVNETAVPTSTLNVGLTGVPPPPPPAVMVPPPATYGQYPPPPTVQFSVNAQPYGGVPPNQPYGAQATFYAPMPQKYSGP